MKPGVFSQLYIHLIFAVKFRDRLLKDKIRPELCKYISGIITKKNHKSIIINGVEDHVHILVGLNPNESVSTLIRDVKRSSSIYINENNWFYGKFSWQGGYGAFSHSRSEIDKVYTYILNQQIHHQEQTFRDEYIDLIEKFKIKYNEQYLFEFFK
jgi:REP element-mobilizing transposase RayT